MATISGVNLDYAALTKLKSWTPLKCLVESIEEGRFFTKNYYEIDCGVYFQASQFKEKDYTYSIDAPFVTAILFCRNEKSASRVINLSVEDDDEKEFLIPGALWPEKNHPAYSDFINFFRENDSNFIKESATYRIASDGKFVHKSIETEKYKIFFRSPHIVENELPYALLYKLS